MLKYSGLCITIGCVGGLAAAQVGLASLQTGVILGGFYGLGFALLASPRALTPHGQPAARGTLNLGV